MTILQIKEVVGQVAPLYPVISVDLFGSYANDEATEDSDIDLLVHFNNKAASLLDLSGLKLDIQDRLHKKVDIVAGPLRDDSILVIQRMVRLYESTEQACCAKGMKEQDLYLSTKEEDEIWHIIKNDERVSSDEAKELLLGE